MTPRFRALLRVFGHAFAVLGLTALFVCASIAGVILHADLPVAHRLAARAASFGLSSVLNGRVAVGTFRYIRPRRLRVSSIELFDRYGERVVSLEDVRVRFDLFTIAKDALFDRRGTTILLNHIRVERTDLEISPDPKTGEPTVVYAISPQATASSAEPPNPRGTRVFLPLVELGRVTAHARLRDRPDLTADLRGVHGQFLATPKGIAVDIKRFAADLRGFGVNARGTATLSVRAPGPAKASFEGFFGDVELRANAVLNQDYLDFQLDAPNATPKAVRAIVPDWPLESTLAVHADANGALPKLRGHAVATAGPASLTLDGPVTLGNSPRTTLAVEGRHLDLRAVSPDAPSTDLSIDAEFHAELEGKQVVATLSGSSTETTLSGQRVPAMDWNAKLADGSVKGSATLHEPGAPTDVTFEAGKGVVEIDAKARAVDLSRIARLGGAAQGRGQARLRVRVEKGTLRANAEANLTNAGTPDASLEQAQVTLDVSGPVATPAKWVVASKLTGKNLRALGSQVDQVQATAKGGLSSVAFTAGLSGDAMPTVTATGRARLAGGVALDGAHVSMRRDPVTVEGDVAEFDPTKKLLAIKNLVVSGAGGVLTGSARLAPGLVEVAADGKDVDLDALSRALGLPRGTLGGKMQVSADVRAAHDVTKGHLRLGVDGATIGTVGGLSGTVSVDLDGKAVEGSANGRVLGFGNFDAKWKSELSGPAFDVASWEDVTGTAELGFSDLDLSMLRVLFPKDGPVQGIAGRGTARFLVERKKRGDRVPDVFASFRTAALEVDMKQSASKVPLRVLGIDVAATGGFNGVTGDSSGTTVVSDAQGELAAATGDIHVDVEELLRDPARAVAAIVDDPVNLVVAIPNRSLADLPEPIRPSGFTGVVNGGLNLRGTLSKPTFVVTVEGSKISAAGSRPDRAVDVHADAEYEWKTNDLVAQGAAVLGGRRVVVTTFRGVVPGGTPEKWTGEGTVELKNLPLELWRGLAKNEVRGKVSGTMNVVRSAASTTLGADLDVADAFVGGTPLGAGHLEVGTDGSTVRAGVTFSGQRGKLDAEANAALDFAGALPRIRDDAPAELKIVAKDFEAGVLSPLVAGVLSRVGGRFDADLTVDIEPPKSTGSTVSAAGGIRGTASLHDGNLLIDALGLQIQNVAFSADARGANGITTLTVKDLGGRVRATKDNLQGSASLTLEGLEMTRGSGELDLTDVPILFRGAPQGRVTGHTVLSLERQKERMLLDVDVPNLNVDLPQASTRNVIDLGENPEIEIVQAATEKNSEGTILPWHLAVHLDKVNLKRNDLYLSVSGTPTIDLGNDTEVAGGVDIAPGGRVPVLGKVFVMEHGTVLFDTGDPSNPDVDVTASFRTGTDSTVYIDMVGPLKTAKLTLRSDPPLPEPDVFALLIGGNSAEPSSQTETQTTSGGAAAGAVAMNSGVAALGVNQILSNNPVELRVDTTSESLPRYTAAVRVRPDLWFEASTYQQSEGVGTGTDRAVYSGTVDYRFARRWSLRTEVGTAGGAMDLLWQYRY